MTFFFRLFVLVIRKELFSLSLNYMELGLQAKPAQPNNGVDLSYLKSGLAQAWG